MRSYNFDSDSDANLGRDQRNNQKKDRNSHKHGRRNQKKDRDYDRRKNERNPRILHIRTQDNYGYRLYNQIENSDEENDVYWTDYVILPDGLCFTTEREIGNLILINYLGDKPSKSAIFDFIEDLDECVEDYQYHALVGQETHALLNHWEYHLGNNITPEEEKYIEHARNYADLDLDTRIDDIDQFVEKIKKNPKNRVIHYKEPKGNQDPNKHREHEKKREHHKDHERDKKKEDKRSPYVRKDREHEKKKDRHKDHEREKRRDPTSGKSNRDPRSKDPKKEQDRGKELMERMKNYRPTMGRMNRDHPTSGKINRNNDRDNDRNNDHRDNDHRNNDHRNNDHRNNHRNNDHRNNDHRREHKMDRPTAGRINRDLRSKDPKHHPQNHSSHNKCLNFDRKIDQKVNLENQNSESPNLGLKDDYFYPYTSFGYPQKKNPPPNSYLSEDSLF